MNPPSRTPEPTEAPEPGPKKSRSPVWLAAAILGAIGIAALTRSKPEPTFSGTSASIVSAPEDKPDVKLNRSGGLAAATGNPLSESFSEPQVIFFTPDESGEPKRRTMAPTGDIPKEPRAAKEKLAGQAVKAVLQAAPDIFPPGTTLLGVSLEGGVPTLNFSKSFGDASFWQGEARTTAALDSLTLSVAATKNQIPGTSESDGVRITVEGQPLRALGEMDLSGEYTPSAKAPPGSAP